ncbi:Rieske 2Fe-2S domain-containing protein [Paenibacillus sp. LMG 31461]|uniref:Rieske 2Fe-2S domain-containing protein n=1 Tax=Paenibacillus plantarum TaxID=2654975 RepID=A0ABX1XH37_9BACL|nr:Rieske (2Fe-2S) protein [Paenibacillus plantarum]NOU67386.1 Rieske 2Fe-2S domain-containing protein [Paenibacillus plantarum]
MNEILIGSKDQFTAYPSEVKVNGKRFFLTETDGAYTLLSSRCPHAGYAVELENGELECPLHGWTFEAHTGRCHNVPNARLQPFDVIEKEGLLFALMDLS